MEDKTIRIACQGAINVNLNDLNELQGNLKDLSDENYLKLKASILKYGFSFPIFAWKDKEDKLWIIDAHQRKRVLTRMIQDGYTVPELPAVLIQADNKVQAKEKLLILQSQYGNITYEGYDAFINEPQAEIKIEDIELMLALPDDIKLEIDNKGERKPQVIEVTCPNCNTKFKHEIGKNELQIVANKLESLTA